MFRKQLVTLTVLLLQLVLVQAFAGEIPRALKDMPPYQFPPQPVTPENAKHWAWMRDFYKNEVSLPASTNETVEEAARRAATMKPSREKLAYLDMEFITFPHFGMSTISGVQQGTGREDPKRFNPTAFDAREWVRVHKAIDAKILIFVAKHHDGFALWPSKLNDYNIRSSPWRDGKGDMVKEISDACREGGLKMGLYISLWDEHDPRAIIPRNRLQASQMTDEQRRTYQEYIETQLHETLDGRYGEIAELWFDGAGTNGAEDWNRIYEIIHYYQPKCLVAMCGFGVRWCGNEEAGCSEVNWNVMPMLPNLRQLRWVPFHYEQIMSGSLPRVTDDVNQLRGQELVWIPQEGDTRLLEGGWHWDGRGEPRSFETLVNTYYASIGMGATLIVSPSPDQSGAFNSKQINRLLEWRRWIEESFRDNLLKTATVTIQETKGRYAPKNLFREQRDRPCLAKAGSTNLVVEAEWPEPRTFNNLVVEENLELGQRIGAFVLEVWQNDQWVAVTQGQTVGHKRVLRFNDVTAKKVRFRVLRTRAEPALCFLGLFKALPYSQPAPVFSDADYRKALPAVANVKPGLRWSYYEDSYNGFIPYQEIFSDLHTKKVTAKLTGADADPSAAMRSVPGGRGRKEHFAMRFDGYFHAPAKAVYTFKAGATNGCRVYFDEQPLIENDASMGNKKEAKVALEAGLHKFTVLGYFGTSGQPTLELEVDYPGGDAGQPASQRLLPLLRHE